MMRQYERLYVEFLYYFNVARDYFECHEVMEELWLEEGRDPLCQGLLQIAVGLYHFDNGNISGSIKLFSQGIDKLQHAPDVTYGIAMGKLVEQSRHYVEQLKRYEAEPFGFYDLDIEIVDPALAALFQDMLLDPPTPHEEM